MIPAIQCIKGRRCGGIGRSVVINEAHTNRQFALTQRKILNQATRILHEGDLSAHAGSRRIRLCGEYPTAVSKATRRETDTGKARGTAQIETGRNPEFHDQVIANCVRNLTRTECELYTERSRIILSDDKIGRRMKHRVCGIEFQIVISGRNCPVFDRARPGRITAGRLSEGDIGRGERQCIADCRIGARGAKCTRRYAGGKQRSVIKQFRILGIVLVCLLILATDKRDIIIPPRSSQSRKRQCLKDEYHCDQNCECPLPILPSSLPHTILPFCGAS